MAGRPRKGDDLLARTVNTRLTREQYARYLELGGAKWLRRILQKAFESLPDLPTHTHPFPVKREPRLED
jgi:hypothetical protein